MSDLLSGLDLKTLLLIAALGGSNLGSYLGFAAPARAEAESATQYTVEALSATTDLMEEIARLQDLLGDCLADRGE